MLIAAFFFLSVHIVLMAPVSAQNQDSSVDTPGMGTRAPSAQKEIGAALTVPDRASQDAIRVTVEGAILMALENNKGLAVERISP